MSDHHLDAGLLAAAAHEAAAHDDHAAADLAPLFAALDALQPPAGGRAAWRRLRREASKSPPQALAQRLLTALHENHFAVAPTIRDPSMGHAGRAAFDVANRLIVAAARRPGGLVRMIELAATGVAGLPNAMRVTPAPPPVAFGKASPCHWCCVYPPTVAVSEAEARLALAAIPLPSDRDGRVVGACPALDPDALRCSIYTVRPATCRGFFSPSRDVCRRLAETGETTGDPIINDGAQIGYIVAAMLCAAAGVPQPTALDLRSVLAAREAGVEAALEVGKARGGEKVDPLA